jgi:hypothetical protein
MSPKNRAAATADADDPLVWTPDGHAISFINNVNGVSSVWEQPVAGGPPKPVTHFTSDGIVWYDWSRDGRRPSHAARSRPTRC